MIGKVTYLQDLVNVYGPSCCSNLEDRGGGDYRL